MTYTLHTGDCRDVMATLPAESVDAIVCDPPYGLSFMGKGSTGCAAMVEGMQFVGIDITPEYVDIARRRLAWWSCSLDGNAIINTEENNV